MEKCICRNSLNLELKYVMHLLSHRLTFSHAGEVDLEERKGRLVMLKSFYRRKLYTPEVTPGTALPPAWFIPNEESLVVPRKLRR